MGNKVKKRWSKDQLRKQLIKQHNAHASKKVTLAKPPWEKLYDRPDFIKVKKSRVG